MGLIWCLGRESNPHARFSEATDFKSVVSTNFTTEAYPILWHLKRGYFGAHVTW